MVDPTQHGVGGIGQPAQHGGIRPTKPRSGSTRDSKYRPRRRRALSDPYDIAAAVARLLDLLSHDLEFGIPENVPLRGYYLNILV